MGRVLRVDWVSVGNAQGHELAGLLAWPDLAGNAACVCRGLPFLLPVVQGGWRQTMLVCIGLCRYLLLAGGCDVLLPAADVVPAPNQIVRTNLGAVSVA